MTTTNPGPLDAITDVQGVQVGQITRHEPGWLTGVTAVIPPPGTAGGVDVRGGGPGTRETDVLDPRHHVDAIDAVILSGGSAFGLAAADGAMAALEQSGRGWPVPRQGQDDPGRVPIVPAAILFDLGRGGDWDNRPGPGDGRAAVEAATSGAVAQGNVGAGTGAVTGGLKGGIGSASAVLPGGFTVGALVAVNAVGSAVGRDGRLLAESWLLEHEVAGLADPDPDRVAAYWEQVAAATATPDTTPTAGTATTLGVIATDARLDKAACSMLARVGHDGFARALSPVHTAFDGDTVFALATGSAGAPDALTLVALQTAAADCLTRAIARAILAATSVDLSSSGGVLAPTYRDALGR